MPTRPYKALPAKARKLPTSEPTDVLKQHAQRHHPGQIHHRCAGSVSKYIPLLAPKSQTCAVEPLSAVPVSSSGFGCSLGGLATNQGGRTAPFSRDAWFIAGRGSLVALPILPMEFVPTSYPCQQDLGGQPL